MKLFIMSPSGRSTSGSISDCRSNAPSRGTMKPTLQLKLSQHLTLTPQLQQSIRLLQLSTLELNAEVERMLQENPLLEKAEEEEAGAPTPELIAPVILTPTTPTTQKSDDPLDGAVAPEPDIVAGADGDWGPASGGSDDDDDNFLPQQVATSSLRDHLNA